MKLFVYAVYDNKSCFYNHPFCLRSKGEALRGFTSIVNDGKSKISLYPHDFVLFELGTFDDITGVYELLKAPSAIALAAELVELSNTVPLRGQVGVDSDVTEVDPNAVGHSMVSSR